MYFSSLDFCHNSLVKVWSVKKGSSTKLLHKETQMFTSEKIMIVFLLQDSDEENPFGDDVGGGVVSMGDQL